MSTLVNNDIHGINGLKVLGMGQARVVRKQIDRNPKELVEDGTTRWVSSTTASSIPMGSSLPSSKSLWDVMKRDHIEGHDVRHVRDIWMEVWHPNRYSV